MSTFTLEAYQNEYLPLGGTEVNTIVTVASDGAGGPSGQPEAAVIVIVDTSGSMGAPDRKIKAALAEVEGGFSCDCRGVGTDWQVSELRRIASRLLGTVDIIAEPEAMAEDFRTMMRTAMGKATRNVALRLWTPQGARVAFVRQ